MDTNLISLLTKGSKLVNLYTGDVYLFIEQVGDSQFVKAVLQAEEKWNKYKMIYEDVPEKELIVDAAELVPNDKIPFISVKGKKLFDVRNLDIVTYTRKKETIKARVVYLGKGKEDKDAVFTFVGQDGQDISDTGKGYTAEQFANDYNTKKKAVKRITVEDGFFAEIDTRFNVIDIDTAKDEKKKVSVKKISFKKVYKPLNASGLRKRMKKLGFYYKDEKAYKKLSLWAIKVKKQEEVAITEEYVRRLASENSQEYKLSKYSYFEAYNIAKQLFVLDAKHNYQIELANIKRKATIDVTEEEKAYTKANIERLDKEIADCDSKLDELNGFRKTILDDFKKEIAAEKAEKNKAKKKVRKSKSIKNSDVSDEKNADEKIA